MFNFLASTVSFKQMGNGQEGINVLDLRVLQLGVLLHLSAAQAGLT